MASIRVTGYRGEANALWEILKASGCCELSNPKTYPRVATDDQTKFIFSVKIDTDKLAELLEKKQNG